MGIILSIFFGFVPMFLFAGFIYWMDRYEKEPWPLLGGVFIWGAVVAAGAAFVLNTVLGIGIFSLTGSERFTDLTSGSIVAPLVEESLKGIAVLLVFLVFRQEFDSLLDAIVYAGITALGFGATENTFYIYQHGYLESGFEGLFVLVFIRVIIVGWQHPFYTSFTGIGLSFTRLYKNPLVRVAAPFIGWMLAVLTHSLHNTLASLLSGLGGFVFSTIVDWTGWFFMLLVVIYAVIHEQAYIRRQLREEVDLGVITYSQYLTATSAIRQSSARGRSLINGHFRSTNRFYQRCAELAHKKQHLARVGEEDGNLARVEKLRAELASLSPQVIC